MLGIVILNYNSYKYTLSCVDSVKKTISSASYRVYVVDNASTDGSDKILRESFDGDESVIFIRAEENNGFSAGNNIGLRLAVGQGCEYVLCTNNDVLFSDGAIETMAAVLDNEHDVAVVGPKVFNGDGTVQRCTKGIMNAKTFVFSKKPWIYFDIFGISRKYRYAKYDYEQPIYPTGMVSGCCFMIRADVLAEIDYLDEKIFLYHEEDVLGAKLRKIGRKVKLETAATIVHFGGASTSKNKAFTRYHAFKSGLYYLKAYAATSKLGFAVAASSAKLTFFVKSLFDKKTRPYHKMLNSDIKKFKRMRAGDEQ